MSILAQNCLTEVQLEHRKPKAWNTPGRFSAINICEAVDDSRRLPAMPVSAASPRLWRFDRFNMLNLH